MALKNLINNLNKWLDEFSKHWKDRELTIPVDLLGGSIFLFLGLILLLVMPNQIMVAKRDVVDGRAFPTLLIIIMMVGSATLVLKELYNYAKGKNFTTKKLNLLTEIKALVILCILLFTYLLCQITGLFVNGACFCCIGFLLYFRCRKWTYYVITCTGAVIIWACFRFILRINF